MINILDKKKTKKNENRQFFKAFRSQTLIRVIRVIRVKFMSCIVLQ